MPETKELVEDENKIDTVIADDISFRGKLKFKKSLKLKGNFEGSIESDGHLIIGSEAKVSANIHVSTVSISGEVNGKVKATKEVELFEKSEISGDIISKDVYIEKGARFNGTCMMPEE